ncbi:AbrB family transcriptional regulator [Azospirillum thermophilum]|uniref:AbrB family transcriptional regulator n=1 Tax=Azospirillum thermophilum TaxID=2202148 RepID=A0A2S2CYP6_9PROT|nr:AbrB family transcriptional regulator [Azospirillum thermophilum]AWK89598.1 AbrB family transcriptional regulator [Azospirillum thermophilum]
MGRIRPPGQWAAMSLLSLLLFALLQGAALPAAALLGPMVAGILMGVGGATVRIPRAGFVAAQALIGCSVAHAVTGSILVSVGENWPSMVAVVLITVLASGLVGWMLVRFGSLPGSTAAWGSSPGGAAAMVAMAEEFGADPRLVAFMQYFRVVLVVVSASMVSRVLLGDHAALLPAVAPAAVPLQQQAAGVAATLAVAALGGWAGVRLRIPAGGMLVPMILGAALHVAGLAELTVPPWLLALVYATLGWCIGLRFTREVVRHAVRAVPQMLAGTLALIALCGGSAWVLTRMLGTDALTAYLATSPGGLDSVAIIAVGSGANVSFVLALQTLRLFVVILTGPPVARLIARYA